MSQKVLRGSAKKEEAKRILQQKPILVLFFMDGCPHCDATMPHWDKVAAGNPNLNPVKIEASAVPDDSGVSGFPTMEYHTATGEVKRAEGEKSSPEEISSSLGLSKGGRRRRTRRFRNRRSRKLRHRTLSRHIAFIK